MGTLRVQGQTPLKGEVTVLGAKNVGFKLMIAALFGNTKSIITNVPQVADVMLVKEIIESIGGTVLVNDHTVIVDPTGLKLNHIPLRLGEKARASTMFLPVLLYRFGEAKVPYPGGDRIGKRPIDRHLKGLERLGVVFQHEDNSLLARGKMHGGTFTFNKITHTGTETLVMAAVVAKGETILENCALEPEVDDLINFLNKMGANIQRQGRLIRVIGVDYLNGADYQVMPDQNEAVTFACMALATRGDIVIKKTDPIQLQAFLEKIKSNGAQYELINSDLRVWWEEPLRATTVVTMPYPGFKTDWQPVYTSLMTQAEGESVIHETVFERRFNYVPLLNSMGARIELFNYDVPNPEEFYNFNLEDDHPENFHAARVFGPTNLIGREVAVPDIRAGATLLLAALVAKGETTLTDISHIERGYEKLEERLQALGANIKKDET